MSTPTPIADMITEMLKNCIPMEMVIVAVRSMERAMSTRQGVDEAAEKRRAWDREYRRRRRGRPPDPPDIHPKPPEVGNVALSFLEGSKKHLEVVIKKEKKERGCKLPPDWKPKPLHYEAGAKLGMSEADVDERAMAMRHWCEANSNRSVTTKANWDAAFMGAWLKDSRNGHKPRSIHPNSPAQQSGSTAIFAGVAAATERRARERSAAGQQRPASGDDNTPGKSDPQLYGAG